MQDWQLDQLPKHADEPFRVGHKDHLKRLLLIRDPQRKPNMRLDLTDQGACQMRKTDHNGAFPYRVEELGRACWLTGVI